MKTMEALFDKEWKVRCCIFICSFFIYFFYFHTIFLNLNSIISSITLDTIKNYFTYVYHIKHDAGALDFNGMSFPYGEHIVYTDCQPILTFILRGLPFTHNYLVGILHALIFFSFIVTPVILYTIFRQLNLGVFSGFFCALAIGLLSPQFVKINGGHHGLTYACVIPLSIWLIIKHYRSPSLKLSLAIFFYHVFLFFLHPYLGFSVCLFCLTAQVCLLPYKNGWPQIKNALARLLVINGLPVVIFKLFMVFTDRHPDRTTEPYGINMMIENLDTLVAPVFGPFKPLMESMFNNRINHYEGHTYLGIFSIFLALSVMLMMPFMFKKLKFRKEAVALLFSSLLLLFLAFGYHNRLFNLLGIQVEFMNQFRATCRFAWFFYYTLPVFTVVTLNRLLSDQIATKRLKTGFAALSLVFFSFNLWEAHYMYKLDEQVFWKFRNIFNENLLNAEERRVIKTIRETRPQAIVPLPVFHSGSEMYDRLGFNNSMIPSMLYASHTGAPLFSVLMSRTSMSETEQEINLLNSYKKNRPAVALMGESPLLILKTKDALMPDETRLLGEVKMFEKNDTLEIGLIAKKDFLKPKLAPRLIDLVGNRPHYPDSNQAVYIPFENRKPFTGANMNDFVTVFSLDSNLLQSGSYVVSLHYHYTLKKFQALASNLIITEANQQNFRWKYDVPLRFLSGFYDGYAVFEYAVELERDKKYEFVIKGRHDQDYKISDFMLRREHETIRVIARDTSYNNFPDK